jgi:hypothetical protein
MNRAGLIVVVAALIVAVVTAWQPAEAREQHAGSMTIERAHDALLDRVFAAD